MYKVEYKLYFKDKPTDIESYLIRKLSNSALQIIINFSDKHYGIDIHPFYDIISENNVKNSLLCFLYSGVADTLSGSFEIHLPVELCDWRLYSNNFNYYKNKEQLNLIIYPEDDYEESEELYYEKF